MELNLDLANEINAAVPKPSDAHISRVPQLLVCGMVAGGFKVRSWSPEVSGTRADDFAHRAHSRHRVAQGKLIKVS